MSLRLRDYRLDSVYLRTTEAERAEIMALWQSQGVVPDPAERLRRSHEVVLMVRNPAGELVGVSTVGLTRVQDGRVLYVYRMFLRPRDRVPQLMTTVTDGTRDFLRGFDHPQAQVAGLLIVAENRKLMRPGLRRTFERHGYQYRGTTPQGQDLWLAEFPPPAGIDP